MSKRNPSEWDERAILGLVKPGRREAFLRTFKGMVQLAYDVRPTMDQDRPGWKIALLLGHAVREFEFHGATEPVDTGAMEAAVRYWHQLTPG